MSSANLTLSSLNISSANARTYSDSTIKGSIEIGGTNVSALPIGNYAKYAHTLFTRAAATIGGAVGTIKEGDRVTDSNNVLYEVLHVDSVYWLDSFSHYICELVKLQKSKYYRFSIVLVTRDTTNGWINSYTFEDDSIYVAATPRQGSRIQTSIGNDTEYTATLISSCTYPAYAGGTSCYPPREGDLLSLPTYSTDANNLEGYWEVTAVDTYPMQELHQYTTEIHYALKLKRVGYDISYINNPLASTRWHLDSESVSTDPRTRMKVWLDTYFNTALLTYEDGTATNSFVTVFAGFPYTIWTEFKKAITTMLVVIDKAKALPRIGYDKKPYGFDESVNLKICCANYADPTTGALKVFAPRLTEVAENEIRRIATVYPYGSIRSIETIDHSIEQLGGIKLYSTTLNIRYTRTNDDYTPTYPTVTWGPSASPTGTYTFPNVISVTYPNSSLDVWHQPFGSVGGIPENIGDTPLTIEIKSDLDVEPVAKTWKRPQTTTPKTDKNNFQVFMDIKHNGSINQEYQTLTLSWGSFKVRLDNWTVVEEGGRNILTVTFKEYRTDSADSQTVVQRYGIA